MERLQPDQWSTLSTKGPTKGPSATLRVTSSFKLPLIDGHSSYIDKGPILTGNCGLGWRFAFSASKGDIYQSSLGITGFARRTIYNISFTPHQLVGSDLKSVSVDMVTENLSQIAKTPLPPNTTSQTITLPTSMESVQLGAYISQENFSGNAIVKITVKFNTPFSLPCANESPKHELQNLIKDTIEGQALVDTKFCLFTRRAKLGKQIGGATRVADPKIIFANSSLLRGHSVYLDDLLGSEKTVIDYKSANVTPEYESDSDLEEDEGEDTTDASGKGRESQEGEKIATVSQNQAELHENDKAILINDVAFKTWKSLVFYYYTEEVHFRPLTSTPPMFEEYNTSAPACSPKSMYRVAKKFQITELQTLAMSAIKRDLSEHNIVDELFSQFTALYPEVRTVEVEVLMNALTPEVFEKLLQKMRPAFTGTPHYYDVVTTVLRSINENRGALQSRIEAGITIPPHAFVGQPQGEVFSDCDTPRATFPSPSPQPGPPWPFPESTESSTNKESFSWEVEEPKMAKLTGYGKSASVPKPKPKCKF